VELRQERLRPDDEQYAVDVFNTYYVDGRVPLVIDDKTSLKLGAQYYPQSSVGKAQIGTFSTWAQECRPTSRTGRWRSSCTIRRPARDTTRKPVRNHASYLSLQISDFNKPVRRPGCQRRRRLLRSRRAGLTASATYARVRTGSIPPTAARSPTGTRPTSVSTTRSARNLLEGLCDVPLRVAAPGRLAADADQLRAYLNYAVRF